MANEFVARNGLIALDNSSITGSLSVSGSIVASGGVTASLFGTASFAITASYALSGPGGGGGLTVNIVPTNNQTVNVPSGQGDTYVYASTGVNTFILPNPAGNKNQYTIKLIDGTATVYVNNFSLIDDDSVIFIDTPFSSIDIISNNTSYSIR